MTFKILKVYQDDASWMYWLDYTHIDTRCIQDDIEVSISIDKKYEEDEGYIKTKLIEKHEKIIIERIELKNKSVNKITVGNII